MEEDAFRYTELDVKIIADGIEISMGEYSKNFQNVTEIRKQKTEMNP